MQIACISVPQKGTVPLTAGLPPPAPGGCAPRPCRFALGGSPATCHQGEVFVKTMGELQPVGAKRKPAVGRWATACSCPWGNLEGKRRGAKAPPGIQLQGRRPSSWGWRSRPKNPQGSRLSVGKCSESTYRRKWQNGGMAHFAILRKCRSSSPRWRSIAP